MIEVSEIVWCPAVRRRRRHDPQVQNPEFTKTEFRAGLHMALSHLPLSRLGTDTRPRDPKSRFRIPTIQSQGMTHVVGSPVRLIKS